MRVDVCCDDISKNKKLFANATFLLGPCRRPYPPPSKQKALMPTWSIGLWVMWTMWTISLKSHNHASVDNVDNRFTHGHVDNVDNQFSIVHIVHIFFFTGFFFLRGNSSAGDLWTMWTMWTMVLSRQPNGIGTTTTVYTYSTHIIFLVISKSLSTLSTLLRNARYCWLSAWTIYPSNLVQFASTRYPQTMQNAHICIFFAIRC